MNQTRTTSSATRRQEDQRKHEERAAKQADTNPLKWLGELKLPAETLEKLQKDYLEEARAIWNNALKPDNLHQVIHLFDDRRFSAQDWEQDPMARYAAAMHLLNTKTMTKLSESMQGNPKSLRRMRFLVDQWASAVAPSNFLNINPEVQRLALETQGKSLTDGLIHWLEDLKKGRISLTDERVFEVGRNLAITEGAVVFENAWFQLIEYKPLTPQVHERPLLMVPPCINKYYILDLQPDNSLVKFALEQGHRVFMVSWVNPDESLAQSTWDDYTEHGVMEAIQRVCDITGQDQINTLGFCVGGTLLATALSVLAAQKKYPAASMTLLTTFLDFSDTGILDIFVDESTVHLRDITLGTQSPKGGELLRGQELASTFSMLRPNELVWNYVVGNYLKGEMPPPFDLLFWNSDSTNLPGPMYCWYLRHTYLQNQLSKPKALTVAGERVDLRRLNMPAYIYASKDDHIVPWESAYANVHQVTGDVRFVLGASGHIAGVINPAARHKRHHWINSDENAHLPSHAQEWLASATQVPGSWWSDWAQWLSSQAGELQKAPVTYGNARNPVIEPAPGRYVKTRA